jgi:small GTP-binding protein
MSEGGQIPVCIKAVIVGFGAAGKTSLHITYTSGEFPSEWVPYVEDNYTKLGRLGGRLYQLELGDTGGGEEYYRLRPLCYPLTDVFILLFDVSYNEDMFEKTHSYWWAELNHHCPDVPIVLVGSKIDLRDQEGKRTITTEEGQAMADKIGAEKYMEVSSLEGLGVTELFDEVISLGFHRRVTAEKKKKKKSCLIL